MAAGVPTSAAKNDAAMPSQIENQKASVNCLAAKKARYQRSEKPIGGNERYSATLTDVRITIAVGNSRRRRLPTRSRSARHDATSCKPPHGAPDEQREADKHKHHGRG